MDLSALIFVALAVAWAVYLVPKALRHHEEDAVSRSIEGFSDRLRVLARREPVSATQAELVPAGRPRAEAEAELPATPTPAPRADLPEGADADAAARRRRRARQAAARRAAARRRRVFNILLLTVVVVGALAVGGVLAPAWVSAPVVLLAAWLVACRLMVRTERANRVAAPVRKRRTTLADQVLADEDAAATDADLVDTGAIPAVPAVAAEVAEAGAVTAADDPERWAPVDVPLPTYVAKAPAGRTVRTIDLDSTGVWSSGRNEADSQLAREAEAQRATTGTTDAGDDVAPHRATGS